MTHTNWLHTHDGFINLAHVAAVTFAAGPDGHEQASVFFAGVAAPTILRCRDDVDALGWALEDLAADRDEDTHRPPSVAVFDPEAEPAF